MGVCAGTHSRFYAYIMSTKRTTLQKQSKKFVHYAKIKNYLKKPKLSLIMIL